MCAGFDGAPIVTGGDDYGSMPFMMPLLSWPPDMVRTRRPRGYDAMRRLRR